jgi:hypothetical protein
MTARSSGLAAVRGAQYIGILWITYSKCGVATQAAKRAGRLAVCNIGPMVAGIVVGVDRSLTIETKPGGLLGLEGNPSQVGGQKDPTLLTPTTLSIAGRQWKLIVTRQTSGGLRTANK